MRSLTLVLTATKKKQQQAQGLIQPLVELTHSGMGEVNKLILSMAGSDVEMIPEISNHLIASGGKRLRPMLTLAAAALFDYQGDGHIKLATSVEFMHTATLLHDDVVDESDLRRGKATARKVWGNQASVLVGDFLLGQAFKMMVDVGSLEALDVLSSAASIIAEGEVMQLAAAKHLGTTEGEYLKVINAKTAALFSAAAEVGPIVAQQTRGQRQALRDYGTYLGLAFQLVDDVLDYNGDSQNLGKNTGDDFREGKITLPVILSYAKATADEKLFWKESLEEGKNGDDALAQAILLMNKYNSLNETIAKAYEYGEKAREALKPVPENQPKRALMDVIDFCVSRLN